MKRFLSLLVFSSLLLIPIGVDATTTNLSISCPSKAKAGDTITCSISSSTSEGVLNGITARYDFSSEVSLVSFTPSSLWTSVLANNSNGFSLANSAGVSSSASIGTLKVKFSSSAVSGNSYKVGLSNSSLSDTEHKDVVSNNPSTTVRIASTNNFLSSLTVSEGSFTFDKNKTSYSFSVDSSSVVINATSEDSSASVSGVGTKSLKYGLNTFKVTVTSEAGTTKTYTLNITRKDNRSDENRLLSLSIADGSINFNPDINSYNVEVASNVSKTIIMGTLYDTKSSFVKNYGPRSITLKYGINKYLVKVKSEKGSIKTYTLNITRKDNRSDNNSLSSISLSRCNFSFSKTKLKYDIDVESTVDSVSINATLEDAKASFVSGYGPRTVSLKDGFNSFLIKVKSEKGSIKTYTINITRDDGRSKNNNLSNITLSSGEITFDKSITNYNVTVEYDVEKITVNATSEDDKAKINYKKENILKVGENKIIIKVTAENNSVKNYTINVTRKEEGLKLSSDSSLISLVLEGNEISLKEGLFEYNYKTSNSKINVVAKTTDLNANVVVKGNDDVEKGNVIEILVTAEDGSTSLYKVKIEQESNNVIGIVILLVILALGLVGVLVFIIVSNNKKNKTNSKDIDASKLNSSIN